MFFLVSFLFLFICYLTLSNFIQKLKKEKEMLTLLFQSGPCVPVKNFRQLLFTLPQTLFKTLHTFAEVSEIQDECTGSF